MPTLEQARLWYPHNDPAHGFEHVRRVYALAHRLALEEGANVKIVLAAALLHDATPPTGEWPEDFEERLLSAQRRAHEQLAAAFAGHILAQEGWPCAEIRAVQHAIRAHRFRDPGEIPQTLEAKVLFDADKLDAIGAIGAARAIAYATQRGEPPYAPPSETFLREGRLAPGETHSAYHEYCFKLVRIKDRLYTASGRRLAQERHHQMVAFFEALAAQAGEAWQAAPPFSDDEDPAPALT